MAMVQPNCTTVRWLAVRMSLFIPSVIKRCDWLFMGRGVFASMHTPETIKLLSRCFQWLIHVAIIYNCPGLLQGKPLYGNLVSSYYLRYWIQEYQCYLTIYLMYVNFISSVMSVRTDCFIKLYWCVCSASVSLSLLRVIATDNHDHNDNCVNNPSPRLTDQISKESRKRLFGSDSSKNHRIKFFKCIFISENEKQKKKHSYENHDSYCDCNICWNVTWTLKTRRSKMVRVTLVFIRVIASRGLHTRIVIVLHWWVELKGRSQSMCKPIGEKQGSDG